MDELSTIDRLLDNESESEATAPSIGRRALVFAGVLIAVVAVSVTIGTTRNRASDASMAAQHEHRLVVAAPADSPGYADSQVWSLPSPGVSIAPDSAGVPLIRFAAGHEHAIVGLQRSDGLVALALWPGLDTAGASELLMSPVSSALAVVALHPDLAGLDVGTEARNQQARMAMIVGSPAFASLVVSIDDAGGLVEWTPHQRDLVRAIVATVISNTAAPPTCVGFVSVAPSIGRCPDGTLSNGGPRAVALVDETLQRCAVVPPSQHRIDHETARVLTALLTRGELPPADSALHVDSTPGTASAGRCTGSIQLDPDTAALLAWEDSMTMARGLGARPSAIDVGHVDDIADLVTRAEGAATTHTVPQRILVASRLLSDHSAQQLLGLDQPTPAAIEQLALLARLVAEMFS